MYDNTELCEKIKSIFPDVGECGMDVDVDYDSNKKVYSVYLKKGDHHLKTYLEPEDADICMDGKQCIGLGFQIQQLRNNIESL